MKRINLFISLFACCMFAIQTSSAQSCSNNTTACTSSCASLFSCNVNGNCPTGTKLDIRIEAGVMGSTVSWEIKESNNNCVIDQGTVLPGDCIDYSYCVDNAFCYEVAISSTKKLAVASVSYDGDTYMYESNFQGTSQTWFGSCIGGSAPIVGPKCEGTPYITGRPSSNGMLCNGTWLNQTPCPGSTWLYCANFFNTGTEAFKNGKTEFKINFDANVSAINATPVLDPCTLGGNVVGNSFVISPGGGFGPGDHCEVCVEVTYGAGTYSTVTTTASMDVECVPSGGPVTSVASTTEKVDCSCDPNNKEASPLGCGAQGWIEPQELTYVINFQNVGMGPAWDVEIIDALDIDLDLNTLHVVAASHTVTAFDLTGNDMTISFDGINLPSYTFDLLGSMGYVMYTISPKSGLNHGTSITNFADIYFDNNPPVTTNSTTHTIDLYNNDPQVNPWGPTTFCEGGSVTLDVPGKVWVNYNWSTGMTTPIIDAISSGGYFCTVEDNNGCVYTTDPLQITVLPLSDPACQILKTKALEADQLDMELIFSVFPNPFNEITQFHIKPSISGQVSLTILDISGNEVAVIFEGALSSGSTHQHQFAGGDLSPGIYFAKLKTPSVTEYKKLIISK